MHSPTGLARPIACSDHAASQTREEFRAQTKWDKWLSAKFCFFFWGGGGSRKNARVCEKKKPPPPKCCSFFDVCPFYSPCKTSFSTHVLFWPATHGVLSLNAPKKEVTQLRSPISIQRGRGVTVKQVLNQFALARPVWSCFDCFGSAPMSLS